jgi:hypothetical protein
MLKVSGGLRGLLPHPSLLHPSERKTALAGDPGPLRMGHPHLLAKGNGLARVKDRKGTLGYLMKYQLPSKRKAARSAVASAMRISL